MTNSLLTSISSSNPSAPSACPTNQKIGKAIDTLTLKAMLSVSLAHINHPAFYFCLDPECPTVYYSADGKQLFTEVDLREKVYQKHPDEDETLICYCFQYSVGGLRKEMHETGVCHAVEHITAGIQKKQCACDIRNPQGDCCLGNVRQTIKRLRAELRQP